MIFLPLFAFILLIVIFNMIDYLVKENYIVECFESQKTSHTVDLPLNTSYTCQNFCGPTARCAITGHQCSIDAACPGCQTYSSSMPKTKDCIP